MSWYFLESGAGSALRMRTSSIVRGVIVTDRSFVNTIKNYLRTTCQSSDTYLPADTIHSHEETSPLVHTTRCRDQTETAPPRAGVKRNSLLNCYMWPDSLINCELCYGVQLSSTCREIDTGYSVPQPSGTSQPSA